MITAKLVTAAARTLWVGAWADWNDEYGHINVSGCELMDIAPEAPEYANVLAAFLLGRFTRANHDSYGATFLAVEAAKADGIQWEDICAGKHDDWLHSLGHNLVMMALGHGVGWFDDHEEFPLVVPHLEIDISDFYRTSEEWEATEYHAAEEEGRCQ